MDGDLKTMPQLDVHPRNNHKCSITPSGIVSGSIAMLNNHGVMLLLPLFSHGDVFSGRTSQRQNLNDGNVILRTIPFSMARAAQTAPVREL